MVKKSLLWSLSLVMLVALFAAMMFSARAVDMPDSATFSDGDVDRVYFGGDSIEFDLSGITGVSAGTTVRVSLGIVGDSGTFVPTNVFTSGLTTGTLASATHYYVEKVMDSDGSFTTTVTGTIANSLSMGVISVQLFMEQGPGNWQNVVPTPGYLALSLSAKPAMVGLDSVMTMPGGVTCTPELGSGAQSTENLYSLNATFSKTVDTGITGSIAFTGLNLMDSTMQGQLDDLNGGLYMSRVASGDLTGGAASQFTMGINESTVSFLASKSATVSVTSATLFDGLTTANFAAAAAGVTGAEITNLTFDDATDTISFSVNHFSSYTVSQNLTFGTTKTNVTTAGGSDGSITVTSPSGAGSGVTYEYSFNDGVDWQLASTKSGLAAGTYQVMIRNQATPTVVSPATSVTLIQPLAAPSLTVTGKVVSWTDLSGETSYKVQIYNDADATVGSEVTLAAGTTSFDLDAQSLGYDGYYIKVKAIANGTTNTDSAYSAASGTVTILNKVTIATADGNPTSIINNGTALASFNFTISGNGISTSGDDDAALKAKLTVSVTSPSNCAYSSYTLTRVSDNAVTATVKITSTAANNSSASFTAAVSTASGSLAASHEAGSSASANVTGLTAVDAAASSAPSASNIYVLRTTASLVDLQISGATSGQIYKAYAASSGGTALGSVTAAGASATISNAAVNSDVSTIYVTKQDSVDYGESARTALTIYTYTASINPSGNATFTALSPSYSSGTQETKTFTIANTGSGSLASAAVALSGTNAASFAITQPSATIASSGTSIFTVKANDSLASGTYAATVTLTAANLTSQTFTVTQTVLTALGTPGSVSVTGTTASWTDVSNETGYQIEVYNSTTSHSLGTITAAANASSASLASFETNQYCTTGSTYQVRVTAVGDMVSYSNSSAGTTTTTGLTPTTATLSAGNITTTRTTDTKVTVAVSGLAVGDVVNVYAASSGGTALGTATVTSGQTSVSIQDLTVTSAAGSFYVSLTTTGRAESARTEKAYAAYTSSDETPRVTQTTPVVETKTDDSGKTTATASPTPTTDAATNKTTGTVTASTADKLVESIMDAERAGNRAVLEIKVETQSTAQAAEASIPVLSFHNIAVKTDADVKVETGLGTVTFNAKAVETIGGAATAGEVKIEIAKVETTTLADSVQAIVGDRPVFDFTVSAGSTTVSDFGGGSASISIPYTLRDGEQPEAVVVYYIDDSGKLTTVEGKYNADTGMVEFAASHFSTYAVGYNKLTFSDVSDTAWYENAVTFLAARGITTGVGNNRFAPEGSLTRAQFVVMLLRAYGIYPDAAPTDNFSDAGDTYYTGYLSAAKRLGISAGVGGNQFAPESRITRQDMFTLLYRTLTLLDRMPDAVSETGMSSFGDAGEVSGYATDATDALVGAGIVSGSDGSLNPLDSSTRAQMAQLLYNLLSK